MSIHSDLFASSIFTMLTFFVDNIFAWIIFLVIMTMIIHIPKLKIISKKITENKIFHQIQKNDFIRSIIGGWYYILLGGAIIFFSQVITSIIFDILSQRVEILHGTTLSLTNKDLQITIDQQRGIMTIDLFLSYGSFVILSLLIGSGFFLMLSCLNIFFRKMSYFLISLCFILFFFMSVFGIYLESGKAILEKYPSEKLYHPDIQVTLNS